jgi:hypothetical protein
MAAPRVFLSYADDDLWWVRECFKPYFNIGNVVLVDCKAEDVAFGELKTALDDYLEGAVAVVAFVSKKYTELEGTVAEWEKSLSEKVRRRLIFVPVMLDADAIEWWQGLRRTKRLTSLSRDYEYADFTEGGQLALPGPAKPQYLQRIAKLAEKVKEQIFSKSTGDPPPPPPPPPPQTVVFLGHPSASLPADLQDEVQQVADALGATAVQWSDKWRKNPGTDLAADADPVFVQPITDAEAADYVEDPNKISTYLAALGRANARVAIWLPKKYGDSEFEKAAAAGADESKFPVLRTDAPQDLANWLRGKTQLPYLTDAMVVQVEGSGTPEGVPSESTKAIVDQLRTEVWNIVSGVVEKPRPASPAWQFWDTQFGRQIKILPGSRAVVAIHDLDINPSADPMVIRRGVERKFKKIYEAVTAEQLVRQRAGKPPLKLFWTALLVNNGGLLPFSSYPDDGLYKDWRLLEFSQPVDDDQGGSAPVPDPASLAVFRTNLHAWAIAP